MMVFCDELDNSPARRAYSAGLDFKFEECDAYCLSVNKFSFTFTKHACPRGGLDPTNAGFHSDECVADDMTISYEDYEGSTVTRTTSLEEAMYVCGDEREVVIAGEIVWRSPEQLFEDRERHCRGTTGDGSEYVQCINCDGDGETVAADGNYIDCVTDAWNECVLSEPETARCTQAREDGDTNYLSTFCKSSRTCTTNLDRFLTKRDTCFDDDEKRGFKACLAEAWRRYDLDIALRDKICKKTFLVEKSPIECDSPGSGWVSCCCMVQGVMISHPPADVRIDEDDATASGSDDTNASEDCAGSSGNGATMGRSNTCGTPAKVKKGDEVQVESSFSSCDCEALCRDNPQAAAWAFSEPSNGSLMGRCRCYSGRKAALFPDPSGKKRGGYVI